MTIDVHRKQDINTKEAQIQFIQLNAARLASCARGKGRGIVCVVHHEELLNQAPFGFLPEADASKLINPWYGSEESKLVSGYDSKNEVVICFIHQGADGNKIGLDCYKISTFPAPAGATAGPSYRW